MKIDIICPLYNASKYIIDLNINLRNKYTENNNYNYTMLVKYIFII